MDVSLDEIKNLRELSGAGIMSCRNALIEAAGNVDQALEILKAQNLLKVAKKADRVATQGLVECYTHIGGRIAAMVELNCETDFVARTDEFKDLAHNLAMQVAATDPRWISSHDVPAEVTEGEKNDYLSEIDEGKPEHIVERIIEGKLAKFYQSNCLLDQDFIKDETKTIQQVLTEAIARLGENIVIKRFSRFQIG